MINSVLCIYRLFVLSNFNFLCNFQGITLTSKKCLVLYSFCASLLHSLIMWLIVSSLSLHNLHLLFLLCLIYSYFDMVGPYGVVFAAVRRDPVSLLRFPFLSHVHVFSGKISLVNCLNVYRVFFFFVFFFFHFCFLVISVLLFHVLSELFLVAVIMSSSELFYVYFDSLYRFLLSLLLLLLLLV